MKQWLACALIAAVGPACSFAFVRTPPQRLVAAAQVERSGRIECTRWPVLAVLDSVLTAAVVSSTVIEARLDDFALIDRDSDIVLGSTIAVAFLASAVYGFYMTAECRHIYRDLAAERRRYKELNRPSRRHGCVSDIECKGDRVCDHGECVAPH